jgi:hypothetical protein
MPEKNYTYTIIMIIITQMLSCPSPTSILFNLLLALTRPLS